MEPVEGVIKGNEFEEADRYQDFSLDFTRHEAGNMEYRVYWLDEEVNLWVDRVGVFEKKEGSLGDK